MRGPTCLRRLGGSAWAAAALYTGVALALTWPLAARLGRDVPGDLLDPLFTCWALGWNFHWLGVGGAAGAPPATSYWDANIFFPARGTLALSEHFLPQALQGLPVYAATRDLVLTYDLLFLSTFILSGTFLYLLARDETADPGAALGAGLLYGFALFRWAELPHLGALSSQWMPLALLLARRTVRAGRGWSGLGWAAALGVVTAVQALSSGYYLLFFPPFLALWSVIEAARARSPGAWWRLAAAGAAAVALTGPVVRPYVHLAAGGARRDLDAVVANSADVLSWVTAPEATRVWGRLLQTFPRGEARLFPGVVTALLVLAGLGSAATSAWRAASPGRVVERAPGPPARSALRLAAIVLGVLGVAGAVAAAWGGVSVSAGPLGLRAMGTGRPALFLLAAVVIAALGWPRLLPTLVRVLRGREAVAVALAALAGWLSLGPVVTWRGHPTGLPSAYGWLYAYVPGFATGRAPARFAMIAACFAALAAAWGLARLRATPAGRPWAWVAGAAFLVETAAVPLPLDVQGFYAAGPYRWEVPDVDALPAWHDGAPSPIVEAVRRLPPDAVLVALPIGEAFHETRAMFDSADHWRRMLNGYSSWIPPAYVDHVIALRDPLRDAAAALATIRAAGATHVIVHEGAWGRGKGLKVTERLRAAGATPVAHVGDVALLAVR